MTWIAASLRAAGDEDDPGDDDGRDRQEDVEPEHEALVELQQGADGDADEQDDEG